MVMQIIKKILTAYYSGASEFTLVFSGVPMFMCYVLYIILSFFSIVLTILLQFTASDYPFGIFKLFLTLIICRIRLK